MQNFALREIPELSIELSAIDMNALFDYSHEIHYQLSPLQLQGRNPAQLDFNLGLLEKRFITGGRVFLEAGTERIGSIESGLRPRYL